MMIKNIFMTLALLLTCGTSFADDYILVVVDTSGSMSEYMRSARESRMKVAQSALKDVLTKVPDSTKVGILSFDGWVYNQEFRSVNKSELIDAVDNMSPGGSTPLYEYIRAGATKLLETRKNVGNTGTYKLLIVTDGEAGDNHLNEDSTFNDGTPRSGVLKDIISRGIIVDAIGLDMGENHSLATKINGRYMRGDDPDTLVKAIQKSVHAEVNFDDGIGEEIFEEAKNLPDEFATSVITALTTYQNHPIGEKPFVQVVNDDGTVSYQPDPSNEPVPKMGSSSGPFGIIFGLLALFVLILGFIAFIFSGRM